MERIDLLRRRIGDKPKTEVESFNVEDDTNSYQLQFDNVEVLNVYNTTFKNTPLTVDTEYSLDDNVMTLLYDTSGGGTVTVSYTYTAFSETELQGLLDKHGVNGATVEALRWLLADSAKLYSYSRGAASESLDQVFKHVKQLLHEFEKLGDLDNPGNDGETAGITIAKRTNQWYRGRVDLPQDLSRDDL